jgi:DNA-binding MarR family transcriptional regulator
MSTLDRAAVPEQAKACAAQVLEVLPGVMNAVRMGMRRQLQGALSVPQFRCMNFIDLNPGVSVGEVATFLGVTMATASAMVDRLARAGYATTGVSAQDRRRAVLTLSKPGKALLAQIRQGARRDLAAALGSRSADELQHVSDALAVLRNVFEASA